jgi:hypothetical protein
MRTRHPSKESHSGSCDVWWRYCRWKGTTRTNIAQLRLRMYASHPSKGNPFGVIWRLMTTHPVAMLLLVMRNGTFYTTVVRKKRGNMLRMRTRSLTVTWLPVTLFPLRAPPVTSLPVRAASGSTTWNVAWPVLIYYSGESWSYVKRYMSFHCLYGNKTINEVNLKVIRAIKTWSGQ